MGLSYRKRIKIGDDTYANISKSGVSISKKMGNVTINSKKGTTVNLGNGVVYKSGKKQGNSNGLMEMLLMQQMMQNDTKENKKKGKKKK